MTVKQLMLNFKAILEEKKAPNGVIDSYNIVAAWIVDNALNDEVEQRAPAKFAIHTRPAEQEIAPEYVAVMEEGKVKEIKDVSKEKEEQTEEPTVPETPEAEETV
jgi:hypothetical protein